MPPLGFLGGHPVETRIVNETTGGAKGQKPARFDLIPAGPLWKVAELYGKGAEKYEDRNWERGYEFSLSFAALMRHAWLWRQGQDLDEETSLPHMASVVFHAFALMEFADTHPEMDNRHLVVTTRADDTQMPCESNRGLTSGS